MHFYRIAGLGVASEIELPGAIATREPAMPDVVIRAGAVAEALPDAGARGATWEIAGSRFLFRIPGIARFLLTDGNDIRFEVIGDAAAAAGLPIFLLGTVFGILLHQRGQIVLHASAVRVAGKAVLFCGASGAGKSTLAAALAQRGFPVVTDDFCAIDFAGDGALVVQSDGRQLKLWAQTIEHLSLQSRRGAAVREQLQKFYVEPDLSHSEPLPLAVAYVLREASPPHAFGIERPNVADATLLLRRNAYRPLLVRRMDQRADYFRAAAAIANGAGIFHLTRPLDFKTMPEVIALLERHWDDLKLMEAAA